jgi:hypothetical protein
MSITKRIISIALLVLSTIALLGSGCVPDTSSEKEANRQQEKMLAESNAKVGMPAIKNFTEKKFAKQIQELRDQEITTYTYMVDRSGRKHFVCESIGYGLPYSVQFTNPVKAEWGHQSGVTTAQADPNGLYMPDNVAATWILCSDGEGGVRPVYSEPELLVSPFKFDNAVSNSDRSAVK